MYSADEIDQWISEINRMPILSNALSRLDYRRVGLRITRGGSVIKEYTSTAGNGRIESIREGIDNPEFVARIEEQDLAEIIGQREWIMQNPGKAAVRYWKTVKLPLSVRLKLGSIILKGIKNA
ncbi:MAG: hypothetical protein ABH879_06610 [archaeon]